MFKKTLMTLGLLGAMTLSGCVVYAPAPRPVVYGPGYYAPGAVVVAPVVPVPVVGFYGGWWGGYGYRGGHWR